MKKDNGFTLIEILAIIIILAIIAVITVPLILNTIEDSKKGSIKNSAYGYIESVNRLYLSKSMDEPDYEVPDNFYAVSDLKNMGVSVSGNEPSGKSWVRVIDNKVVRGCLQFGEYSVSITDGVIGNVVKGECHVSDPVSLETDSWEMIKAAIDEDNTDLYNVGDTKEVLIDGVSYTVRLVNKTFTGCDTEENGFSQTACGFVFEFVDIIDAMGMNSGRTNVGGWPATDVFAYLNIGEDCIYNKLSSDLRNVIADTYTVSGHGSKDSDNFVTTNKLYLLSAKEIFGDEYYIDNDVKNTIASDTARYTTKQLEYYEDGNSIVVKRKSDGASSEWWLRDIVNMVGYVDGYTGFRYISFEGLPRNAASFNTEGISPAFRIVKD